MILAGSIVQIDTAKREISSTKDWIHELQRPIYFLKTPEGYVCGWCELDSDSQWLTLIPHPYCLPQPEVEVIGQKSKSWASYRRSHSVGESKLAG